jgi:hypothetical protein
MVDYLALAGTVQAVAEVNGVSCSNLQSAINMAVGTDAVTVKLLGGVNTEMTLSISDDQNVILDLNGFSIISDLDVTLKNEGTLTIINSSITSNNGVYSSYGTAIENTGVLNLGEDDGTYTKEAFTIEGASMYNGSNDSEIKESAYGIKSSGTLNFFDGSISGKPAISSGTISSKAQGMVIRTTVSSNKEMYYLTY